MVLKGTKVTIRIRSESEMVDDELSSSLGGTGRNDGDLFKVYKNLHKSES